VTELVRLFCGGCATRIGQVERDTQGRIWLRFVGRHPIEMQPFGSNDAAPVASFRTFSEGYQIQILPAGLTFAVPTTDLEIPCAKCQRVCSVATKVADLERELRAAIAAGKRTKLGVPLARDPAG
jgi:hypothetical protein